MLAKQLVRASLQTVKASTPSVARQSSTRISIPVACLQSIPSNRFNVIRSISSTTLRLEQTHQNSPPPPTPPNPADNQAFAFADLPAVYLSNLSFSVTEETLTEFLKQHTPVKKVDVVRNTDGAARGFGFAKYATEEEAQAAVGVINGLDFLGRSIVAALSQRRPVLAEASNQLFMSGFPTQGEADEAALRCALQEKLGVQPRAIRLHKFPGGFLKGTGHLEFDDIPTVENVITKLQELGPNQPIEVNGHVLNLVRARPLLQSRSRGRGAFGNMRGPPPAYGAPYAGAYGGYPSGPVSGYPAQGNGGYQNQGYDHSQQFYPPPPSGPGSGGYGGYGSQGEGGQGGGAPTF